MFLTGLDLTSEDGNIWLTNRTQVHNKSQLNAFTVEQGRVRLIAIEAGLMSCVELQDFVEKCNILNATEVDLLFSWMYKIYIRH